MMPHTALSGASHSHTDPALGSAGPAFLLCTAAVVVLLLTIALAVVGAGVMTPAGWVVGTGAPMTEGAKVRVGVGVGVGVGMGVVVLGAADAKAVDCAAPLVRV